LNGDDENQFVTHPDPTKEKHLTMKTFTSATDTQLVQAFQQGNNEALEILINKYKDKLFSTIKMLVKDQYLAEDLFQDTFIKIISTIRAGRYNDEGKFLPWASRIAHNLCIDHFRKLKNIPTITTSDDRDIFEVLNFSEEGAEKTMMKTQSHSLLHKMVDLLPQEQKEVIVLRHFADLSFKEIADITNTNINTALGRMRYGLKNIRKMMEENQVAV
jgi:RNA polymerase sigma factor (sigma-70 family)